MKPLPEPVDGWTMSRREAIRRSVLFLGVAISPSILAGVMQAQPAARTATAKPAFLTAEQFETAGAVAERILPRTDTPGATEVGVPAFIDLMYGRYMTDEEKSIFAAGLAEIGSTSRAVNQRAFAQLNAGEQDVQLKRLAAASQDQEKTFFHQIRELTILGYFSSEAIGRNVLHYDPIPGQFRACVPIAEVGNVSWTR